MGSIEANGKTYETDEEGYLADLNSWDKDVAEVMAKLEPVRCSCGSSSGSTG